LRTSPSPDIRTTVDLGDTTVDRFTVEYGFKNHGRTPAIITKANVAAKYIATGFPRMTDAPNDELPTALILSAGESKGGHTFQFPIVGVNYQSAKAGTGKIFCWGKLEYRDVFDVPHETGICAEWDFGEARFIISKTKEMNYHT
jgi:hypothetical protein